jgi:hypothetical protein
MSDFIEQADYWTSLTRQDSYPRGMGKWMLHTDEPHRLYRILQEQLLAGRLTEAYSIKTKTEAPLKGGAVYLHTGPYTDQGRITRLAEELRGLDRVHEFRLTGLLLFKTDLHNTWCETLAHPEDRYYALLKRNWLYQFSAGTLVVNAAIQALHRAMEEPPENADKEFLIIRSMLPVEVFAGDT